jgi:hypothetical protein
MHTTQKWQMQWSHIWFQHLWSFALILWAWYLHGHYYSWRQKMAHKSHACFNRASRAVGLQEHHDDLNGTKCELKWHDQPKGNFRTLCVFLQEQILNKCWEDSLIPTIFQNKVFWTVTCMLPPGPAAGASLPSMHRLAILLLIVVLRWASCFLLYPVPVWLQDSYFTAPFASTQYSWKCEAGGAATVDDDLPSSPLRTFARFSLWVVLYQPARKKTHCISQRTTVQANPFPKVTARCSRRSSSQAVWRFVMSKSYPKKKVCPIWQLKEQEPRNTELLSSCSLCLAGGTRRSDQLLTTWASKTTWFSWKECDHSRAAAIRQCHVTYTRYPTWRWLRHLLKNPESFVMTMQMVTFRDCLVTLPNL